MADCVFARRFLKDLAEWEGYASPRDTAMLETALAQIAENPAVSGRVPTFYDPTRPSYLFRVGALLIHYHVADGGDVEFLNLFFKRS